MIEAFEEYYILFTIIFAFIFTFLQEGCIDKLISHLSGSRSAKFGNWFNASLSSYSRSSIKNNCKWLRLILVLLIIIGSLCAYINLSVINYFIPAIILIFLIIISPELLEKSAKQLLAIRTSEIIAVVILTVLNILYHKPNLLYFPEIQSEEEVLQYMLPVIKIILMVKAIPFIIAIVVISLVQCSKIFTMILLKHDNPSKYIAKYVLSVGSSYLLSLGVTKLIIWGKPIILESIHDLFIYV